MPTFPTKPAELIALLKAMAEGFRDHPDIYPNPPYPTDDVLNDIEQQQINERNTLESKARFEEYREIEKAGIERLRAKGKANIAYAVHTTHDERELNFINWSNRSAPTPTPKPDQPIGLDSPRHGDGTVYLTWIAASTGGKVQAFNIQRREIHTDGPDTDWTDCGMSVTTQATLINQPKGLMLEYRVIAVNFAGFSSPSNVVSLTM